MGGMTITAIALGGFGFAATAIALGVRNGSLRAKISLLENNLSSSLGERDSTRREFEDYIDRTKLQIEAIREKLNDNEDMLAACTDPTVIHSYFDRVLQEATGGDRDKGSD